jgi:hypothetical protein
MMARLIRKEQRILFRVLPFLVLRCRRVADATVVVLASLRFDSSAALICGAWQSVRVKTAGVNRKTNNLTVSVATTELCRETELTGSNLQCGVMDIRLAGVLEVVAQDYTREQH